MGPPIKVSGARIRSMVQGCTIGLTEGVTKEAGGSANYMEMVNIPGQTVDFIKGSTIETRNMGMGFTSGRTVNHMKATGSKAFVMDKVSSVIERGSSGLGSGSRGIGKNGYQVASSM